MIVTATRWRVAAGLLECAIAVAMVPLCPLGVSERLISLTGLDLA